jgi:hypothetical protein
VCSPAPSNPRRLTTGLAFTLALVTLSVDASVAAQGSNAASVADSLFEDARGLMQRGDFAHACPKLEESQRIDPGGGTLLNLATCYESQGRLAAAWTAYREGLSVARRDGRKDRIDLAEERIRALEPRLPRLRCVAQSPAPGLELFLDGVKVGSAGWDTDTAVDPGVHRVRAQAPGRLAFETTTRVSEGQLTVISIPALSIAIQESEPAHDEATQTSGHQRLWGAIAGSVGTAGMTAAGVFAVLALGAESTADSYCPGAGVCKDQRGLDASDRAHTMATGATISVAVGVAGLAAGTLLWVTAPRSTAPSKHASGPTLEVARDGFLLRF